MLCKMYTDGVARIDGVPLRARAHTHTHTHTNTHTHNHTHTHNLSLSLSLSLSRARIWLFVTRYDDPILSPTTPPHTPASRIFSCRPQAPPTNTHPLAGSFPVAHKPPQQTHTR